MKWVVYLYSQIKLSQSMFPAISCGPHCEMRYQPSRDHHWAHILSKYWYIVKYLTKESGLEEMRELKNIGGK